MGKIASVDDREQGAGVEKAPLAETGADKNRFKKCCQLMKSGRRLMVQVLLHAQGSRQRLCECGGLLCDQGRRAWIFLRTQWILVNLRFDNNPIWVAIAFVVALLFIVYIISSLSVYGANFIFTDFMVKNIGEPFRQAIRDGLLCSEKECKDNAGKLQSPIGDYLALEVVVYALTKSVENLLRGDGKPTGATIGQQELSFRRCMGIALAVVLNFVLTSIISYGFLFPLPKRMPLRLLYCSLIAFMFGVGVFRMLFDVHRAFPESFELISDAIHVRKRSLLRLSMKYQDREIKLEDKTKETIGGTEVSSSLSGRLLLRWCRWRVKVLGSRSSCNGGPKHSFFRQFIVNMVIRLAIVVVVAAVVGGCEYLMLHAGQSYFYLNIVVAGGVILILMGFLDGISISSGVFVGMGGRRTLALLNALFLITYAFIVYALNEGMPKYSLRGWQIFLIAVAAPYFLFVVERICLERFFERRDFELVSLAWMQRSLRLEIDALQRRLERRWTRRSGSSNRLSNKGGRRSSWPPSRSRRSFMRRVVRGGSPTQRRNK